MAVLGYDPFEITRIARAQGQAFQNAAAQAAQMWGQGIASLGQAGGNIAGALMKQRGDIEQQRGKYGEIPGVTTAGVDSPEVQAILGQRQQLGQQQASIDALIPQQPPDNPMAAYEYGKTQPGLTADQLLQMDTANRAQSAALGQQQQDLTADALLGAQRPLSVWEMRRRKGGPSIANIQGQFDAVAEATKLAQAKELAGAKSQSDLSEIETRHKARLEEIEAQGEKEKDILDLQRQAKNVEATLKFNREMIKLEKNRNDRLQEKDEDQKSKYFLKSIEQTNKMKDDFRIQSQEFVEADTQLQTANSTMSSIEQAKSSNDLAQVGILDSALIYAFAKAKDPNGRVTEADYAAPQETAPFLDIARKWEGKTITGALLSDTQRAQILQSINDEVRSRATTLQSFIEMQDENANYLQSNKIPVKKEFIVNEEVRRRVASASGKQQKVNARDYLKANQ